MNTEITKNLLPNWQRFVALHQPQDELVDAFALRLSSIEDITLREALSERINVELWILLLSTTEVDASKYKKILNLLIEPDCAWDPV